MLLSAATAPSSDLAYAQDSLALSCVVCHGSAEAPSRVPNFYELSADQIGTVLREFRSGTRTGTAMPRLSTTLSDTEIDALARYYGKVSP